MDPVALIVGALAAGAFESLADTAKAAADDLYDRVRARLAGNAVAESALAEQRREPGRSVTELFRALEETGAAADPVVVALASRVMAHVGPGGVHGGRYAVDVTAGRGVQVGDHNTQANDFTR